MDALDVHIAKRQELAREALLTELRSPSCGTCGHALTVGAWRSPAELKAKVYGQAQWVHGDGAVIGLALHDLEDASLVEFSARHEVRLTAAGLAAVPGDQNEPGGDT